MPVSYELEDEVASIVVEGEHSLDDFYRCVEAVTADPDWTGSAWLLVDVRRSSELMGWTPRELRAISSFMSSRPPGTFRYTAAILVSSTLQIEKLSQNMQAAELSGAEARAFYEREQALSWLKSRGASPPPARASSDSGERSSVC